MTISPMPNYPLPSTVHVSDFISVKPSPSDDERSEYEIWKKQMLCLLESQGLLGFIDGQIPPPSLPEESTEEQKLWRRTDRLIMGWILGSVGKDALSAVVGLESSREVWEMLGNIFNQKSNSSSTKGADGKGNGEGNEAAVLGGGIKNFDQGAGDEDNIVELQPRTPKDARKDYTKYLPLRRAITKADWTEAGNLLDIHQEARTTVISEIEETALLVAVTIGKRSNDFVSGLLDKMQNDMEALAKQNTYGNTALHRAVMIGNKETSDLLLDKNSELLYILNKQEYLPVHIAAIYCHKRMLVHLLHIHEKHAKANPSGGPMPVDKNPFDGKLGASLLSGVIISQFIDVALYLARKYPDLAGLKNQSGTDALYELARSASVFKSGANFSWWQKWIYSRIVLTPTLNDIIDDIENLSSEDEATITSSWFDVLYKIPFVKSIKEKKVMHQQAVELVKRLCVALESLHSGDASPICERALLLAAHNGINEVVQVIMEKFPTAINTTDTKNEGTIFHVAARVRSENVFNLFHQMKEGKHFFYDSIDPSGNNYMHVCGEQAPAHKLNLVSGAALQMQRELQWFKEMEKFVTPSRRTRKNNEGKTPYMLFTEKHQELKSQGEKWMKDTATSCTFTAALIATVVFAAAFTVPGGVNNDSGIPIYWDDTWFITFAISDSISLFSSAMSLLMFLSILTSRYAEEDFLYVLPTRLCIGLLTLFTSITFMVIAFGIAIYVTLRHKSHFFLVPLAALACVPVASFVFSQFPLLKDAMYSTYGPGIFGEKSAHTLY